MMDNTIEICGGNKMARAKYQVLVIPYHVEKENIKYCIFKRSDMDVWQFIAGGGEHTVLKKRDKYGGKIVWLFQNIHLLL